VVSPAYSRVFDMSHLTQHEEAYFGTPNRSNEEMATMAAERSKVTFPVRELTYFFYGGEEEVKYRVRASLISVQVGNTNSPKSFHLTYTGAGQYNHQ